MQVVVGCNDLFDHIYHVQYGYYYDLSQIDNYDDQHYMTDYIVDIVEEQVDDWNEYLHYDKYYTR